MRIALVSRSLAPFGGGGIGVYVDTMARILVAAGHEVAVFTTSFYRDAYEALRASGDPDGLLAPGADYVFVPEPVGSEGYYAPLHSYAAANLDAIVAHYPVGGPDLIEVPDYLGEGFVLAQARATADPRLSRSLLLVRLHTTSEICAVLNGHHQTSDFGARVVDEMERYALRHADHVLWPGGDVLALYERFYGADGLAPGVQIRNPLLIGDELPEDAAPAEPGGPLKLLYLGRLERRKGVQNLLRAIVAVADPNWRLTLVGGDTSTAPLGGSIRSQLELMAAGDERIEFLDHMPRSELDDIITAHDVVVLPSLWECWPYAALEAMRRNRPVLATPTGGFTELIRPGVNGWLTRDATVESLSSALEELLYDREATFQPRREGAPRETVLALAHPDEVVERYVALHESRRRPQRTRPADASTPLVSVVIPYYKMSEFVEETVRSITAQTHPRIELLLVNDGSFAHEDAILDELAARYPLSLLTQPNSGLGAARNFGVAQARGRYVLPLDADNLIAPTFVERCVEVLEANRSVAYVTSWSRYVDELGAPLDASRESGYQPIGNESGLIDGWNVAGDAAAVVRRRIFDLGFEYSQDLTSFEDWHFYLELHRAGHYGRVIPDRLLDYRVRRDSMIREIGLPKTSRLVAEISAHVREKEVTWTKPRNA